MASSPMPKKNCTKTKGFRTKRRHRELLAPLNAAAAAAVFATVVLASPPVDDDETLRRKKGLVNDPVVPPKCKQECTIRRPVNSNRCTRRRLFVNEENVPCLKHRKAILMIQLTEGVIWVKGVGLIGA